IALGCEYEIDLATELVRDELAYRVCAVARLGRSHDRWTTEIGGLTRTLPKPIMPTPIAAAPKSTIIIGMGRCLLAIARCVQCRLMTSLIGGRTADINGALF